ncbi:MAG: OmpA family protein [Burkholderiaceae bacterium]|nr:OmpA family protein [Burkholderiaceae bacterium]
MPQRSSATPWLIWLLALASCTTPPKPPKADESRRRPVNTAMAVELQSCRHDLDNTRIVAAENQRKADVGAIAMAQTVQQQMAHQQALERLIEREKALAQSIAATNGTSASANVVMPVRFAFGSADLTISEVEASRLIDEARTAPLVVLRGRTDGAIESPAESHIARRRVAAVEAFLVRAGVERDRIRTTWQPIGDHAADNATPAGRALNRRVEIEIYRQAPVARPQDALARTSSGPPTP